MNVFDLQEVRDFIRKELPIQVKKRTLVATMEGYFSKAAQQQNMTEKNRADGNFAAQIWALVSLLDAAVCNKSYPAEKYLLDKEWDAAVRFLRFELKKRKLFSDVPIYDLPRLGNEALAALQCLNAGSCGSALVDSVRENGGSMTDLFEAQQDLMMHMKKLTDTPGLLEALQ